MDKPHEGHVKVMLAYGHTLFYGNQGFRPFSADHREAAQPMGAAVASVKVHCDRPNSAIMSSCDRLRGGHGGHVSKE